MSTYTVEAVLKASGLSGFQQAFASAEGSITGLKDAGAKVGDIGKKLTKGVTLPVMGLGTGAIIVGKEYEASMSQVAAVSGATGKDLDKLKGAAREMGGTTRYSASESADALGYMALAGWDVEQMTSALPGVLNLATAGNMDLAAASDIVTDTMSMFGIGAEDAGKASDIFAKAQSKSNTNVDQLSEALLNAGPAASAAGADLEQTSAVLGIFANQGLKGGRAGTTLNAMYRDLKAGAKDGAVAIGDSSVAVYDANGNMRSMGDIMADVEQATEGMTDAQRDAALADVFKQQSLSGVNMLLSEGSGALKDLENEIYNSEGAAEGMAGVMDDNLNGALANMRSALEEVAIGFYDMAGGPLTFVVQKLTDLIRWFGDLSDETKQWIIVIAGVAAAIGPAMVGINMLITGITMLMSPVTLIIAALGAFAAAVIYLWNTNEEFREGIKAIWDVIKTTFQSAWGAIKGVFMSIAKPVMEWFEENQESIRDTISSVWESITTIVSGVVELLGTIITKVFGNIKDFIDRNQDSIKVIFDVVWTAIKVIVGNVLEAIAGVIEVVMGVITGDWKRAWEGIKDIFSAVWDAITTILTGAWDVIKTVISGALEYVKDYIESRWEAVQEKTEHIWKAIQDSISETWESIKDVVSKALDFVKDYVQERWDEIKNKTDEIWNNIKTFLSNTWENIKSSVSNGIDAAKTYIQDGWQFAFDWTRQKWNDIKNNVSNAWATLKTTVSDGISGAVDSISDGWQNAVNWTIEKWEGLKTAVSERISDVSTTVSTTVDDIVGFFDIDLFESGKAMINSVWNGVNAAKDAVIGKISDVAESVRNLWPFSPAKEGPLKDIDKMDFAGPISKSIERARKPVVRSMAGLAGAASKGLAVSAPGINVTGGNQASMTRGGTGDIVQNITVISPDPTSPSENARKMKQASRELARGW